MSEFEYVDVSDDGEVVVEEKPTSFGNGIIGALIGAFIGLIPLFILSIMEQMIYILIFVFVFLLGRSVHFFYKAFRGAMNKNTKYIIFGVTISSIVLFNVIETTYFMDYEGLSLGVGSVIRMYTNSLAMVYLRQVLGITMLAGVFSAYSIYKKIDDEEFYTKNTTEL